MLFHILYAPGEGVYFEVFESDFSPHFDPAAFERVWQELVDRNPVLRTSFVWEGLEEPVQVVHRQVKLPFSLLDWRGVPEEEQRSRLEEHRIEERRRGFNLLEGAADPLQRDPAAGRPLPGDLPLLPPGARRLVVRPPVPGGGSLYPQAAAGQRSRASSAGRSATTSPGCASRTSRRRKATGDGCWGASPPPRLWGSTGPPGGGVTKPDAA